MERFHNKIMKTEWTSTRVPSHWVWISSFCEAAGVRGGCQTHNPLLGLHNRDIIAQCDKCFAEMNSCLLRWSENTLTINRCITVADCQAFGWRGRADERGLLYCWKAAVVVIELTESYYVWIQVRLSKQEKVFTCIFLFSYPASLCASSTPTKVVPCVSNAVSTFEYFKWKVFIFPTTYSYIHE